jgi:hypothetical protein
MKHINNFIVERLILSKTRHSAAGMTCTTKDFLGDIIIEPIEDVKSEFVDVVDNRLSYYNVLKAGIVIGIIETNTHLYFNLIVSSSTYKNIMGVECTPSETDYPDLPANIQKNILKHYFTDTEFIHGGGIADIDVFIKDKNEYNPRLYNLPGFQELLKYIETTL